MCLRTRQPDMKAMPCHSTNPNPWKNENKTKKRMCLNISGNSSLSPYEGDIISFKSLVKSERLTFPIQLTLKVTLLKFRCVFVCATLVVDCEGFLNYFVEKSPLLKLQLPLLGHFYLHLSSHPPSHCQIMFTLITLINLIHIASNIIVLFA